MRFFGFLADLDLGEVRELLEELLRGAAHVRALGEAEELLDAAGLGEAQLAGLAGGHHQLDLALEHRLDLLGVERRERAVVEPDVLLALGQAAAELVAVDGDALALEGELHVQPVHPARHLGEDADRLRAHLGVDEIFRDEEVPVVGKLGEAFAPEADRLVAGRHEPLPGLVRSEAERGELVRGLLLGGDVDADAARALHPFFRRLDDHRRGQAVGADLDLVIAVGREERGVGLDQRAAGAHPEGRDEIDHLGDLAEIGELGADLEGDLGQALHDDARELAHRLADGRRSQEPSHRGGRDALVDPAGDALLGVDVPAGPAFEPAALQE